MKLIRYMETLWVSKRSPSKLGSSKSVAGKCPRRSLKEEQKEDTSLTHSSFFEQPNRRRLMEGFPQKSNHKLDGNTTKKIYTIESSYRKTFFAAYSLHLLRSSIFIHIPGTGKQSSLTYIYTYYILAIAVPARPQD